METNQCRNCGEPISRTRRRDALYCSDVCGSRLRNRKHYKLHPEEFRLTRLRHNSNDAERMYTRSKSRAKKLGIPFSIEVEDIVVPELCPVLGLKLKKSSGKGGWTDNSPSLDRIKPELGYIKGNVRVISARANLLKSNATVEELGKVLEDLRGLTDGSARHRD